MYQSLATYALIGLRPVRVRVEVSITRGTPLLLIVGLAPGAARACRERLRAAADRAGARLPGLRITVNLAPADLPKSGASFDLPILLGALAAAGRLPPDALAGLAALGELGLDGAIRPVRGVLPVSLACRDDPGLRRLLVPAANLAEAGEATGLEVHGATGLRDVLRFLAGTGELPRPSGGPRRRTPGDADDRPDAADLADLHGQPVARRVLEIAAAGGHHLLLLGDPGAGKTMLARRLPGLLPPLEGREALEASTVHSVAGLLDPARGLLRRRPFRAPHHTVTPAGLVGGGAQLRPGEVSLAHRGVLFLDELGEFRPAALEALRQPLESGDVRLVRSSGSVRLPARFQLVAATNGCPCGFATSSLDRCTCHPREIRRYFTRISGPLLDRIDLVHEMAPPVWEPDEAKDAEASRRVASRVAEARRFARRRGQACPNAELDLAGLRRHVRADDAAGALLAATARSAALGMRACHKTLRVARTIADLGGRAAVGEDDVAEALSYRRRVGTARAPAG